MDALRGEHQGPNGESPIRVRRVITPDINNVDKMDYFGTSARKGMALCDMGGFHARSCQKVRMEGFKGNEK